MKLSWSNAFFSQVRGSGVRISQGASVPQGPSGPGQSHQLGRSP